MTDRPVIGLVLALLVEASHWTRIRWDFDEEGRSRAWQLTSIGILLSAMLIWLDGTRYTALPALLSWLPPLLLPMHFVQAYGMRETMPLITFSFLARRRRDRNQRLGLIEQGTEFHFGNLLFAVTMVASSVGTNANHPLFLPGLAVLSAWLLWSSGHSRLSVLVPTMIVAALLARGGQFVLEQAEQWIGRASVPQNAQFDPNHASTRIGTRGPIQQSREIAWRMRPAPDTPAPHLLRTGSFNLFVGSDWRNRRDETTDFIDLDTRPSGKHTLYRLEESDPPAPVETLPCFTLRGSAPEQSPLPIPGNAAGLIEFELDGVERNPLGTVRVFPKHPVIEGSVFWNSASHPEGRPLLPDDLRIPSTEKAAVGAVVRNLALSGEGDLRMKLAVLQSWFHQNFRYTRNLSIRHPRLNPDGSGGSDKTPIASFLNRTRAGHCEYFATAAALILRECGIPTRYTTGYAVIERDPKRGEFILRGTHAHAWCRVWDRSNKTWIDFDPTPPDWSASISDQAPWSQAFSDWLKCVREDFFLWRNRPANRTNVFLTMTAIGLSLAAFVIRRLWVSRKRLESKRVVGTYQGPHVRTPLHGIEPEALKHLGHRKTGQPFATWLSGLRKHIPNPLLLDEAIELHQRIRFDPRPATPVDHERLAGLAAQITSLLKRLRNAPPEA